KQMSTKTTFKRVALVAVAALGFGMLSVVPSSATHLFQADSLSLSASASSTTVGTATTITATQTFLAGGTLETMTVTSSFTSVPSGATIAELPTPTFSSGSNSFASFSTKVVNVGAAAVSLGVSNTSTMTFTPTKVGTYVIKFTPEAATPADVINSTAQTWTVTVTAAGTSSALFSTSVISPGLTSGSSDATIYTPLTVGSSAATILVTPLTSTGSAISVAEALTATITGPGNLGIGGSAGAAATGRSITGTAGNYYVSVWADGTAGTSTVKISSGSLVLGTETLYFTGPAASVTSALAIPVINSGSGATAVGAVTAVVKDAAGNGVSGVTLYAVSGTSTVIASATATSGSAGTATFNLQGLTAGTSAITVQNVAAGSTATYSAPAVTVRAGSNAASSVTMTLDKATYAPGELATVTVMIKDAAGNAVVDGTYAAFAAAVTSTRALSAGTLPTASLSTGSSTGTLTFKVNAPVTAGDFVISALGGSTLAAAQAGLAISATGTVVLSTETLDAIAAAADAAAEATDAANAATDAANAAAEAADAATAAAQDAADAVASLSAQVATLISGLKAQLTALTNLVIKIQKKVKA
ncbi:MAG: Ig-like domain-containing protein, partial [Actinomycetes bacterium]